MMDLDSAIQHCEEVAEKQDKLCEISVTERAKEQNSKCAEEHRQLAEWLKELKAYRENTCGDAVSRKDVLDCLKKYTNASYYIEHLPSVTPQQRTGRWIEVIDETDSFGNKTWHHECSICGSDKSGWGTYKHCPDCGTKMEVSGCTKNI